MAAKPKPKFSCLILEDDPCSAKIVADAIRAEGGSVLVCDTIESARRAIEQDHYDLAVLDHNLPDGFGSDFFYYMVERRELTIAIMLTGFPQLPKAVELTRNGLFDYLTKPFALHDFTACIRRAILRFRQNELDLAFPDYTHQSEPMREISRMIQHAANHAQATVLLSGETGTGKDITARIIHQLTFKKQAENRPFISLNCSTLPPDMFEAELFGAQKGAYTGAHQLRTGLCEAANGGTLFLDEIAEVPMALQAKLLQFLETFEYRRLGSPETLKFEGRIIAATNKSIPDEVAQGRFREDLWYRLDVLVIHLPPLRERKDDIPNLTDVLLDKLSRKYGHQRMSVRPEDMALLNAYDFPGNIRELRNLMERSLLQTPRDQSWLQLDNVWLKKNRKNVPLPAAAAAKEPAAPEPPPKSAETALSATPSPVAPLPGPSTGRGNLLEEGEFALIQKALIEENGVIRRAAIRLGLTHQSLLRRLEKWPELRDSHKAGLSEP